MQLLDPFSGLLLRQARLIGREFVAIYGESETSTDLATNLVGQRAPALAAVDPEPETAEAADPDKAIAIALSAASTAVSAVVLASTAMVSTQARSLGIAVTERLVLLQILSNCWVGSSHWSSSRSISTPATGPAPTRLAAIAATESEAGCVSLPKQAYELTVFRGVPATHSD